MAKTKKKKEKKKRKHSCLPRVLAGLTLSGIFINIAWPAGAALLQPEEDIATVQIPAEPPVQLEAAPSVRFVEPEPEPAAVEDAENIPVEDGYFSDAVFLGDSRTEGFHLYSGLREGNYFYAVGATVESVFTKEVWPTEDDKIPLLDAMAEADCSKVYIMLGINELGWSKSETYYDQYAKLIDRIREDHPNASIVLQSILPVSARQEAKKSYVNNERIAVYNELIRKLAQEKGCVYMNVAEAVIGEDGCLQEHITSDGVHLNVEGCRIWLDYLKNHPV